MLKTKLVITFTLCFFAALVMKVLAGAPAVAMLTGVYGPMKVKHGRDSIDGKPKMALYNGDVLTTYSGNAVLILHDSTEVKMGPGTTLTINFQDKKKSLLVTMGKIWADITKQKSRFEIGSPHGAAAIEGTQLQYEVSDSGSTCNMVSGSVSFGNDKKKFTLTQGKKSTSESTTGALTAPEIVQVKQLIKWQVQVLKFSRAIPEFSRLFNEAAAKKRASGIGSIHGSEDQIAQMKEIQELAASMVSDSENENGMRKLKHAFATMYSCLLMNPLNAEQEKSMNEMLTQGQNELVTAQAMLQPWIDKYIKIETQFTSNASYIPPPVK